MRVPDAIKKCVVFVMYAKDEPGEPNRFAGTAFWLAKPSERINTVHFGYLVTAWHVIVACQSESVDGKVWLRVNLKDGNRGLVFTDPDDWLRHPTDADSVDVAVLPAAPTPDMDAQRYPVGGAVSRDAIDANDIGIGDRLFFPGLFAAHAKTISRDVPILRRGTIAAMPGEKVRTKHFGRIDAYLAESRSIGGLSGSPVFVDLGGVRGKSVEDLEFHFEGSFYLMGVMHGHWDHPVDLPDYDDTQDPSPEQKRERVNMGIAMVVPIQKVLETLDHPDLVAGRQQQEEKIMEETLPEEDGLKDEGRSGSEPERLKLDDAMKDGARRVKAGDGC